uniref:Ribonuclease H-like domain, reverse transcriptase, RNA-dependent DNA polymerase n=1 Tax=Tanacetum cinerariifolium TaxID=118510 RepID=A0A6L2M024_TANCI|nr:ribonuclease H-like domain, reverse transcriptase, RNA-dependent DNA polymerase [Tanacetum cinerariifolium]
MSTPTFAKTHNLIAYLEKPTESEGFEQIIDFLHRSSVSYALTASPTIRTSCIKQFWRTAKVKTINDEVRIQALINENRCLSSKTSSWNEFSSTMASAIICLATNQKFNFSRYILLSLIKNIEAGVPFFMFPRFVQLLIDHQLGDMSHHKDIYGNPSLTKKVPAAEEVGLLQANVQSTTIPTEPSTSKPHKKHKSKKQKPQAPKVLSPEPSPKHRLPSPSNDQLPGGQDKLEGKVAKLKEENRVLKELHSVYSKADTAAPVVDKEKSFKHERIIAETDEDVEINLEEAQAKLYNIDLEHPEKVLKVVTTAGATTTPKASKVSVLRRRMGVIIQDPDETTSTFVMHLKVQSKDKGKGILIEEPKPLKGKAQIEQDEAFVRQLEAELNADINWNAIMEQVTGSERLNDAVIKYQALKRKPLTEAQVRKNMIIYLKNMAGFKMNYFKGMTYSEIRPLFEKHFNYNQAFLEEVNEEVTLPENKVEVEAHKRECESLEKEVTKKQNIDKEAEDLKSHLHIVANDDDDDDNFDREDLETLWKLVKESVWRDQKGRYGLANVKSWKLFESVGVHCITFSTTQMFLLVEKRYPLTHFTQGKMLNNVRLEVEEVSEMSLELLRLVRRQLIEGYVPA